jgi:VanZ family protein
LFAVLALRRRSKTAAFFTATALGAALSTFVEITQCFVPGRDPSIQDVIANTAGTAAGAVLALWAPQMLKRRIRFVRPLSRTQPAALAIVCTWVLYRLFPLFPVLGTTTLARKLLLFFRLQGLPPVPVLSAAAEWFAVGALLAVCGINRAERWLALSLLLIPAQFFIVGRQPSWAESIGALAGYAAFIALRRNRQLAAIAGVFLIGILLFRGLSPFHMQAIANRFEWIPLASALQADWQSVLRVLVQKAFYYGITVWMLRHMMPGYRTAALLTAALLTAALLAVIEAAQVWIPGRTPEITDPLLALVWGEVFLFLKK